MEVNKVKDDFVLSYLEYGNLNDLSVMISFTRLTNLGCRNKELLELLQLLGIDEELIC